MALDFSSFEKALASLKKAHQRALQNPQDEELRDASIQRFEYTFELAWKMLKRQIQLEEGNSAEVDSYSKKTLFRVGGEKGLIQKSESWFEYLEKRNRTVHTYDPEEAIEVFAVIENFIKDADDLILKLKTRNA